MDDNQFIAPRPGVPQLQDMKTVFGKQLNPAAHHKVICAIDFGTSGTGYAYAFCKPQGEIDVSSEIFLNKPWPSGGGGKTSTSIVLKDGICMAFGKRATEFISNTRGVRRADYDYFHHFKMQLFEVDSVNSSTMLTDEQTGKKIPVVEIIGLCLKQVKNAFMQQIDLFQTDICENEILWVVTVPAIWKDGAKKVMREAAVFGGLIESMDSFSLMLVLEPEAASVWCLLNDHISLKTGETFLVADCGGGTIDVTVHQLTDRESSTVKEASSVSGGDWGSTAIDRLFFTFIKKLVGDSKFRTLLTKTNELLTLRDDWEKRKLAFNGEEETSIKLPRCLQENIEINVKKYNLQNGTTLTLDLPDLILPCDIILKFFSPIIEKIVTHIERKIADLPNLKVVVIVGNFANCRPLQEAFLTFGKEKQLDVIVPPVPGICVVKGAVVLGHRPGLISEHISRYSFGSAINQKFDPSIHEESPYRKIVRSNLTGYDEVAGVMDWFVVEGEPMPYGKTITRVYTATERDQTTMKVSFCESLKRNRRDPVAMYLADPSVRELEMDPTIFARMTRLTTLVLSSNPLKFLPPSIGLLRDSLKVLLIDVDEFEKSYAKLFEPYIEGLKECNRQLQRQITSSSISTMTDSLSNISDGRIRTSRSSSRLRNELEEPRSNASTLTYSRSLKQLQSPMTNEPAEIDPKKRWSSGSAELNEYTRGRGRETIAGVAPTPTASFDDDMRSWAVGVFEKESVVVAGEAEKAHTQTYQQTLFSKSSQQLLLNTTNLRSEPSPGSANSPASPFLSVAFSATQLPLQRILAYHRDMYDLDPRVQLVIRRNTVPIYMTGATVEEETDLQKVSEKSNMSPEEEAVLEEKRRKRQSPERRMAVANE
ncbi:hypothetical protein HK096_001757, partial [Nowakowskiella sp. JEL0078]